MSPLYRSKETVRRVFSNRAYIELYDSTMAFIKNNTKKGWRKDSDKRVELPDYPERALEEGLVNAP